jgi:hypothetical protein
MAVAMLWMVTLGGESNTQSDKSLSGEPQKSMALSPSRQISCFLNGLLTVIARGDK